MKFSEERPNDGDTIETLFPDEVWRKVEYSADGAEDALLIDGDIVVFLDEYPDMEWRCIEGEDMSGLLEGLPDKQEPDPLYYEVTTHNPLILDEFLAQFGARVLRNDDEYTPINGEYQYRIEMPIQPDGQTSAWASYIIQHIQINNLGYNIFPASKNP